MKISDGATNYGVNCLEIPPPSNHSIPRDPSHPKGKLKGVQGSEAGDNKCMIVDNINGLSKNKTMIYEKNGLSKNKGFIKKKHGLSKKTLE